MWLLWLIVSVLVLVALFLLWRSLRGQSGVVGPLETGAGSVLAGDPNGLDLGSDTGPTLEPVDQHFAAHGHYLATACDLAYLPTTTGVPRYRDELNVAAQLISIDNTQAYVLQNSDSIVVAFRGSEKPTSIDGFKDWLLTNARNFLVLPEGRIGTDFAAAGVGARFHRGFMSALAEIWSPLQLAVEQAHRTKERPIWVTGHSLGGAIALLAAWRFHQKFLPVHRIVTFGAPMIGNNAAALAYQREFPNKIIRYVDFGDMVPKLPATGLLQNDYDHVQREIVLGGGGKAVQSLLVASTDMGGDVLDEKAADGLWSELRTGMSAHLMGNYISRIAEDLT